MNQSPYENLIRDVLGEYGIQPNYIEKNGKVFKVYSNGLAYGLKTISLEEGQLFSQIIHFLYRKGYYRFAPIYPTKKGNFYVLRNRQLFYLMPWFPNEERINQNEKVHKMFRELARLHAVTVKEIDVNKEGIQNHYEKTSMQWKREMDFLDQWMEYCEQKWYMSPFEWEFVQYYHEVRKAYEYALNTLDNWKNKMDATDKIRTVLAHGKLGTDHFLFDDNGYGYFINIEKSQFSSSFRDVLPFLVKSLKTYPKTTEESTNWIFTYFKHFPLKEEEKLLFKSYLAHPGNFIKILEGYHNEKIVNHERKATFRLQKNYWLFKNLEAIIMKMEEMEKKEKNQE